MAEDTRELRQAVERKMAGDELDRLTAEIATRDGIKFSQAARRVATLRPGLYNQYRNGTEAVGSLRGMSVLPTLSEG